jgi:hypothetical protein
LVARRGHSFFSLIGDEGVCVVVVAGVVALLMRGRRGMRNERKKENVQ